MTNVKTFPHIANLLELGIPPNIALHTAGEGGWIQVNEEWTYNSSFVVNVDSPGNSRFENGTRIRFVQGGTTKYFIVGAAGTTTLSFIENNVYSVANSDITEIWYSLTQSPIDFPDGFVYTPAWTGTTTNPTIGNGTLVGDWMTIGRIFLTKIKTTIGSTTTLGSGQYRWALPSGLTTGAKPLISPSGLAYDSSASQRYLVRPWGFSGTTVGAHAQSAGNITLQNTSPTLPFSWATSDFIEFSFIFYF